MNFIPLLFYDLIARVVPGCLFITLLFITCLPLIGSGERITEFYQFNALPKITIDEILNFWAFLILIVLGYLFSIIVTVPAMGLLKSRILYRIFLIRRNTEELSEVSLRFRKKTLKELKGITLAFSENPIPELLVGSNKDVFFDESSTNEGILREFIVSWDPVQGNRIIRTNAEKRLCEILIFGLILIILVNFVLIFFDIEFWKYHLIIILLSILTFRPILKNRIRHIKYLYKATMSIWLAILMKESFSKAE